MWLHGDCGGSRPRPQAAPWCRYWFQHPHLRLYLHDSLEHHLEITPPWQVLTSMISIFLELSTSWYDLRQESSRFHCWLWWLTVPVLTALTLMCVLLGIYLWSLEIWCTMENSNTLLPSKKRKKEKERKEKKNNFLNTEYYFVPCPGREPVHFIQAPWVPQRVFLRTFLRTYLGPGWCHFWNDINGDAKMPNGASYSLF